MIIWLYRITLDFRHLKKNRLCTTAVFCSLAAVFCPFRTRSYSQLFHTLTSQRNCGQTMDKPWTNRGTPVYFHGTDVYCRGTAVFCRGLGYPEKREITGPKLWECLFEVEKGEKTTKWWCTKKRENKPSSLINRLCQNSCKINRLWKSRDYIPSIFERVRFKPEVLRIDTPYHPLGNPLKICAVFYAWFLALRWLQGYS